MATNTATATHTCTGHTQQQGQQEAQHPTPGSSTHMNLTQLLALSMGNRNGHDHWERMMEHADRGAVLRNPDHWYFHYPGLLHYRNEASLLGATNATTSMAAFTSIQDIATAAIEQLASLEEDNDDYGYDHEYRHDERVVPDEEADAEMNDFPPEQQQ